MEIIGIFFLQNGLKRDSTFFTKSVFGNIAVHQINLKHIVTHNYPSSVLIFPNIFCLTPSTKTVGVGVSTGTLCVYVVSFEMKSFEQFII